MHCISGVLFWCISMFILVHSKKYFYIYEWPNELQDVYPPPGAILDPHASYSHEFYENNGAGM